VRSIKLPRRIVQFGCALAFVAIPFLNYREISTLSGNLLAFNFAGVPLNDPLSAAQTGLATLSLTQNMLIGTLLVLLIAVVLGPAFCSWLCPYGLLSELGHGLSRRLGRRPAPATPDATPEPGTSKPDGPPDVPFLFRLLWVLAGLAMVAVAVPFPLLNQLSMPGWYTRLWQSLALYSAPIWGGLVLLLAVLGLEIALGKRLWCRYFCPQSVLISLFGAIFPKRLQVAFTRKKCTCPASDRVCQKTCSLCLDPRSPLALSQRLQCTNCGDCVDACRNRGQALGLRFGQSPKKK
jgi:ferredoxin-type protein NapH